VIVIVVIYYYRRNKKLRVQLNFESTEVVKANSYISNISNDALLKDDKFAIDIKNTIQNSKYKMIKGEKIEQKEL